MPPLTTVIIKGNPKFVAGNPAADDFYQEIKAFLENIGYVVTLDPGEPYTSPPPADLWIGHSRGVDRLRFAPPETKTLAFGSSLPGSVNHPLDSSKDIYGPTDTIPNAHHYAFTEAMKQAILAATAELEQKQG